jgi:hypothetical protein
MTKLISPLEYLGFLLSMPVNWHLVWKMHMSLINGGKNEERISLIRLLRQWFRWFASFNIGSNF